MKDLIKTKKGHFLFVVASTIILLFSFTLNGFGAMKTDDFIYHFKSSEALVVNHVFCSGNYYEGQLLEKRGGYGGPVEKCEDGMVAYSSQYGLQGRVYTKFYKIFHLFTGQGPEMFISVAQIITALASSFVLALFGLWVRLRVNSRAAYLTILFIALSPMLVGFSRNLYWAMPLMFLPLIYVLFTFELALKSHKNLFLFLLGLGILLYIRYLTGYEYVTTLTIMPISAAFYYLFMAKARAKSYVKHCIALLIVSVLAFTASFCTHVLSLNSQTGSTKESTKIVLARGFERSTNFEKYLGYVYTGFDNTENSVYKITDTYVKYEKLKEKNSHLIATVVSLFSYVILPVINIPITLNQPFAIYSQSLGAFLVVLVFIYLKKNRIFKPREVRQITALFLATLIGFLGYLSWLVMAHSHSLVHLHINGILMYMPMALFGFVILSLALDKMFIKYIVNRK